MAELRNLVSQAELRRKIAEDTEPRTTLSFYRYFPIADPRSFRDDFYASLEKLEVLGRIHIAHEGINAQMSVPQRNFEAFRNYLYSLPGLEGTRLNLAVQDDGKSFWVLTVKVRPKIVADGIDDPAFSMERRGAYLKAAEFNALTDDPETVVVDMRNYYEYEVGHFENALEIPSDTFREQLPMAVDMLRGKEDANVVMYCTGGIRCEKASAYLKHHGFRHVYHLEGGIIGYAHKVQEQGLENKFRGRNFVFDDRMGESVSGEIISHCHQCGAPCDTHHNCDNIACHLLFLQCPACREKYDGCCSEECRMTKRTTGDHAQNENRPVKPDGFSNSRARRMEKLRSPG